LRSTLFPYTTLFRSERRSDLAIGRGKFIRSIRSTLGRIDFELRAQLSANGHNQSRVGAGCGRNTEVAQALSGVFGILDDGDTNRSEEHTSELQSPDH